MKFWRRRGLLAGALLAGAAAIPTEQSWKESALASFDEAWKTINESFYDPSFGGLNWLAVGQELRPRVEASSSLDAARAVIREMLGRLKRSHFGLLTNAPAETLPGPAAVPIEIRIGDAGPVITRVSDAAAMTAGLGAGQVLLYVDGRSVAGLSKGVEGLEARAAALEIWRRVHRSLHGFEGTASTLRVLDVSGAERTVVVKRTIAPGETVPIGNLPAVRVQFDAQELTSPGGRRAGLIAFNIWLPAMTDRFADAVDRFRSHDGIILDLRGNPGGLAGMIGGIAGHFIGEPLLLGTMQTRYAPKPLVFNVNPRTATADGRRVDVFRGPLAILVDEMTGSTSETFVGSVQGLGRARVFGRQTMGQALPALTKQLATGDVLMYAIGDFTTAGGKSLEGAGVTPDISVRLSPKALAAGRDEALEAALKWVDSGGK